MSTPTDQMLDPAAIGAQDALASGLAMADPDQSAQRETERKEVRRLSNLWDEAQRFDRPQRKQYALDRAYAAGRADESWAVDANLIGNYIDVLVAYLYARNPDLSIKPAASVGAARLPDIQLFAETLNIVVTRLWRDGRLKPAMKRDVRSGLSVGVGWLKVVMLSHTERDPEVEKALNDVNDNIARVTAQRKALEEGVSLDGATVEPDVQIAELERTMQSLQDRVEVVVRKGLAIDFVEAQDMQVSLDVRNLADYLDAAWMGNAMYAPKSELRGMFDRLSDEDVKRATSYYQRVQRVSPMGEEGATAADVSEFVTENPGGAGDSSPVEFARVVEIWDRRDNHVKTLVSGLDVWAKVPFQPKYGTTRFFPYFLLGFYWVDGERHPQSLPWRLRKLQDEYAGTRSNGRLSRQRSIPGVIFNAEAVEPESLSKLENSTAQELVGVKLVNPNMSMRDVFVEKPIARIDPLMFDTRPAVSDMEKISGVQEALQTSVTKTKTATQAEIEQAGFAARTSADRDEVEDLLQDMARYTAELAIQCLTTTDVQRIAGAGAFWPEGLPIDEALNMVEVEIVAASTGKPDLQSDRESWAAVLPLLQSTMLQVMQARAVGQEGLAQSLIELIRETLRRAGDRIDVERFIPQPTALPATPGAPTASAGNGTAAPGPAVAGTDAPIIQ